MIGIGKWSAEIKTFIFSGSGTVEIIDNNGCYGFKIDVPQLNISDFKTTSIEENGNTLTVKGESSLLEGKEIIVCGTFEEDTVTGYIKIPLLGKISLTNGHRI